jgi:hypothetical protein
MRTRLATHLGLPYKEGNMFLPAMSLIFSFVAVVSSPLLSKVLIDSLVHIRRKKISRASNRYGHTIQCHNVVSSHTLIARSSNHASTSRSFRTIPFSCCGLQRRTCTKCLSCSRTARTPRGLQCKRRLIEDENRITPDADTELRHPVATKKTQTGNSTVCMVVLFKRCTNQKQKKKRKRAQHLRFPGSLLPQY